MGLKILHSADWHLDTPFTGYSGEQQRYLKIELAKIPETVADLCRRENCDLVLLAGDLFDGPYTKDTVEALKKTLASLAVPVFISPGNHDFCGPGSPWLEEVWPENVHVFTGGVESVSVPELNCRVYGAAFRAMDCPGLLEGFRTVGEERYQIGVFHGDPVQQNSPYNPISAAQVRESGLHYLALGHIHRAGSFRAGETLCAWSGSPMGRGYDETGEKSVFLLELGDVPSLRRVSLGFPCFYEMTMDSPEERLEDQLPMAGNLDFYRVTLTGQASDVDPLVLRRFPHLELRDRREHPVDIWSGAAGDTLEGTFFGMLRDALEEAEAEDRHLIQLAAELSRKILDGREVAL